MGRIAQLKEMGFSDEVSRRVLAECAWDVNKAIDRLLLSGGDLGETTEGLADATPGAEDGDVAPAAPAPAPAWGSAPAWGQGGHDASAGAANGRSNASRAAFFPAEQAAPSPSSQELSPKEQPQAGRRTWAAAASAAPPQNSGTATATATAAATTAPVKVEAEEDDKAVEPEEPEQPDPPKRLERAMRDWTADDPSQLSVTENAFINVWTETATDNGWIHAELVANEAKVGWVPVCVLTKLPEGQKWMRTKQQWEAMDESQCSIKSNEVVNVWVSSLTKEGWTYVEDGSPDGSRGWMPVFCLAWNEN